MRFFKYQKLSAIADLDVSFKDGYVTAAWVIEGDNAIGRTIGRVIVPGGEKDHAPYHSEQAGILSTMIVVNYYVIFITSQKGQ